MAVLPFIPLASIRSNPLGDRTASHTGIALYSRSEPPRARKSVHAYAKRPPRQRLRSCRLLFTWLLTSDESMERRTGVPEA